jgi:8-hydroxy-5-deazaflavin:NADPH oxidoreductase
MPERLYTIAVLGGTGNQGYGLALRWGLAGHSVIIGSREAAKAQDAAREINNPKVTGTDNLSAAESADIAVLTVPFSAQEPTLNTVKEALAGKLLVDVTVPLVPPKVMRVQMPPEGSAGQRAQRIVGAEVTVVSAFQNVSAEHLRDPSHAIDCDVLVSGDSKDARETVVQLAADADMKAWHVGALCNASAAEALTSLLIFMNKRYKIPGAGIRITGSSDGP